MSLMKKYWFSIFILIFSLVFLYSVRGILLPFILGFLIAYLFKNLVKKFESKIPRSLLSLIFVLLFSTTVILISIFVFPMIFNQLTSLIKDILRRLDGFDFNKFYEKTNEFMLLFNIKDKAELNAHFNSVTNFLIKFFGNLTNSFINSSFQIMNIIFMIFISPIVAFYVLRDWDKIFMFIRKDVVPREFKAHFLVISKRIDDVLHHYIVGQLNVCLILGIFYSLLLFLIDFKYSFVIGIVSGFFTLLPYVGAFCGLSASLLLGYLQFGLDFSKLFLIFFIFCLGQFLEGNFVTPSLIGNKIKVHPLWLIFAILAGGSLYGFWGIVVSMPFAAIFGVLIRFYFEKRNKKRLWRW